MQRGKPQHAAHQRQLEQQPTPMRGAGQGLYGTAEIDIGVGAGHRQQGDDDRARHGEAVRGLPQFAGTFVQAQALWTQRQLQDGGDRTDPGARGQQGRASFDAVDAATATRKAPPNPSPAAA